MEFEKIKKLTKAERNEVFLKYKGRCTYCGEPLKKGWHADHILPIDRNFHWNSEKYRFESDGTCRNAHNNTLENHTPSCASCNIQKNSYSVEDFRENIKQFVNSLNLYSTQYKFAKRYGLVSENDLDVVFFFENVERGDVNLDDLNVIKI